MSWLDKIKNGIILRTADGAEYRPLYMNASFTTEYNYTEFNFVDVGGSLVKRKKPIGRKYALELHFQGPDHLDVVKQFVSSIDNNEGPIQIEHPLYDILRVQITSLGYDDTAVNKTKVTGTVIETLEDSFFFLSRKDLDQIPILIENTQEISAESLTITIIPNDINTMQASNEAAFSKGVPIIQDATDFEDFTNAFNTAINDINTATATPLLAMNSLIAVITLPAKFEVQVEQRIGVLLDFFNTLRATIGNIISVSSKQIFSAQQSAVISAICQAAATPLSTDFRLNTQIYKAIDNITTAYSNFIVDLDSLQADNGGNPLGYVPDAQMVMNLNDLVNLTTANLFNIALSAKSERYYICDKDTNIILLTHFLYGLDDNDANIDELVANNDFGIDEYIQVEKGRKITYYI